MIMSFKKAFLFGVFVCSVILFADLAVAVDKYKVVFSRKDKLGGEFNILATGSNLQTVKVRRDDEVIDNKRITYDFKFDAEAKVLLLSQRQQASKIAFTVNTFSLEKDGKVTELYPKGTVITAYAANGNTAFESSTGKLQPIAQAILPLFISVDTGGINNDDIFGCSELKAPGDTWQVDQDSVFKKLRNEPFAKTLKIDDISGEVKFVKIVDFKSVKCMEISAEMNLKNSLFPVPPPFAPDKSSFKVSFSGIFPVDVSKSLMAGSRTNELVFSATGEPGDDKGGKLYLDMRVENDLKYWIKTKK
jgi:hypothetical protein